MIKEGDIFQDQETEEILKCIEVFIGKYDTSPALSYKFKIIMSGWVVTGRIGMIIWANKYKLKNLKLKKL